MLRKFFFFLTSCLVKKILLLRKKVIQGSHRVLLSFIKRPVSFIYKHNRIKHGSFYLEFKSVENLSFRNYTLDVKINFEIFLKKFRLTSREFLLL